MDIRLQSDWVLIDQLLEWRRQEIRCAVEEGRLVQQFGRMTWFSRMKAWRQDRKMRVGKGTHPIRPVISRES